MKVAKFLINFLVLSAAIPFGETLGMIARKELKALTVEGAVCNPELGDLFSTLCGLVKMVGLEDTLSDTEGMFTVFAPTNSAFKNLQGDTNNATNVLLFHTVSGQDIKTKDLKDGGKIFMANGGKSTTTRRKKNKITRTRKQVIFQSGPG